jgi:purine-cytosine permease-like protein
MSTKQQQPEVDRVWAIEMRGIEPIADHERHGRPFELFWIWFAANIGILGIVYGGILAAAGLNLWQSLLVALLAPFLSFLLVGVLSLAGTWGGAPMLTLSRAAFGPRGNLGPAVVSWISLVGWETISVITAAYALLGLLNLIGLPSNPFWTAVSLVLIALLVVGAGLLGHATLVWVQRAATWTFGLLTLPIAIFLLKGAAAHWPVIIARTAAHWDTGVLATMSILIAGTGLSWANTGADYTRYLPRQSKGGAIIWWTICGSVLPLCVLIMVGVLLSTSVPGLASAANPIQVIGAVLPSWMAVPYFVTAIGGLVAGADLSIYSSGLNLLAVGLRLKRYQAVLVDGVLMVAGATYVMLIAQNFLGPFENFLQLLADGIATWSAVFLVDMWFRRGYEGADLRETGRESRYFYRHGVRWEALTAWGLGLLVSLALTFSPQLAGPFAGMFLASGGSGYLPGFLVSALVCWGLFSIQRSRRDTCELKEGEKGKEA